MITDNEIMNLRVFRIKLNINIEEYDSLSYRLWQDSQNAQVNLTVEEKKEQYNKASSLYAAAFDTIEIKNNVYSFIISDKKYIEETEKVLVKYLNSQQYDIADITDDVYSCQMNFDFYEDKIDLEMNKLNYIEFCLKLERIKFCFLNQDDILDKISKEGIESLTPFEKYFLDNNSDIEAAWDEYYRQKLTSKKLNQKLLLKDIKVIDLYDEIRSYISDTLLNSISEQVAENAIETLQMLPKIYRDTLSVSSVISTMKGSIIIDWSCDMYDFISLEIEANAWSYLVEIDGKIFNKENISISDPSSIKDVVSFLYKLYNQAK